MHIVEDIFYRVSWTSEVPSEACLTGRPGLITLERSAGVVPRDISKPDPLRGRRLLYFDLPLNASLTTCAAVVSGHTVL